MISYIQYIQIYIYIYIYIYKMKDANKNKQPSKDIFNVAEKRSNLWLDI